jgi:hypothetical protein
MTAPQSEQPRKPFVEFSDLPKTKLANGTEAKLKAGRFKKSRLGRKFDGKHND